MVVFLGCEAILHAECGFFIFDPCALVSLVTHFPNFPSAWHAKMSLAIWKCHEELSIYYVSILDRTTVIVQDLPTEASKR